ncbi:MAG: T9SS type A sorting domain-containing protein [Bacteroidota bacterium]|jgi:hypothetical protein
MKSLTNHFLHLGLLSLFSLGAGVQIVAAQDRGNTSAQEYGDPVYRVLDGLAGFLGYNYNHTAIFSGLDNFHNEQVREALGSGTTTHEVSYDTEFTNYKGDASNYYGAYTLNNRTMSFTDRKSVVSLAIDLVNAAIAYPPLIPACLDYYGTTFDGTVADIMDIRCDGFVEYCYEKNGFRVWRNQLYADTTWSIAKYPDYHNDRPDITRNPESEASPWAQRGAPPGPTGPQVILDFGYILPDTKMTSASVIKVPTYQVTQATGSGYVDVTVRATDESGIHYIGYKKPGDANWSYSPTQVQDPTSDSYSYTVRVITSGYFYTFAVDNGGNYPASAPGYLITVSATSVEQASSELPISYSLGQNYPNPFNPSTKIGFAIAKKSFVSLKVYDLLGKEVAVLVNSEYLSGNYEVAFVGTSLASGIYFYRLQAGLFTETKKLILLR